MIAVEVDKLTNKVGDSTTTGPSFENARASGYFKV